MKKTQPVLEWFMIYGWAIIVVIAAIGALAYFGVIIPPDEKMFGDTQPNNTISPQTNNTTCTNEIWFDMSDDEMDQLCQPDNNISFFSCDVRERIVLLDNGSEENRTQMIIDYDLEEFMNTTRGNRLRQVFNVREVCK